MRHNWHVQGLDQFKMSHKPLALFLGKTGCSQVFAYLEKNITNLVKLGKLNCPPITTLAMTADSVFTPTFTLLF